jgi:hypothetical protein
MKWKVLLFLTFLGMLCTGQTEQEKLWNGTKFAIGKNLQTVEKNTTKQPWKRRSEVLLI